MTAAILMHGVRKCLSIMRVIELADFLAPDDPGRAAWAELRKQQAKTARENAHVSLIKNSDTGEWNDIHPLDKKTAATRLVEAVIQNEK